MGCAAAARKRVCGRHFADLHVKEGGFHDHFAGKLHAAGTYIHLLKAGLAKSTHAAVKITARRMKKELSNSTEHRVSDMAIEEGHRLVVDSPLETVANRNPNRRATSRQSVECGRNY